MKDVSSMHSNVNQCSQFEATTENFLISDLELCASQSLNVLTPTQFLCDPNLNNTQKMVYQFICSFTAKSGVFFASHEYVNQSLKISRSTFERACRALHEQGYLYRRKISRRKGGSIRCLSPKQDYKKYIEVLMSKNYFKVAAEVEAYFTKVDLDTLIERNKQLSKEAWEKKRVKNVTHRIRSCKSDASNNIAHEVTRDKASSNIYNIRELKEGSAAALAGELRKRGFSESEIEIGCEFFERFKDKICSQEVSNPMGYLIAHIRRGWAKEKLDAIKAEENKVIEEKSSFEANRKLAEEAEKSLRDKEEATQCRVRINENHITFDYLQDGRTRTSIPVGYSERNFQPILNKLLERVHDRCRNTR